MSIRSIVDEPRRLRSFRELDEFLDETGCPILTNKPEPRPCPDCGEDMPPRRRVCDRCLGKRRRAAYRKSKRRARGGVHT